ncbi:hypothetical protein [Actinoplanes sp. G11-F43]|uniref:hypothetical protein n=1 Tax=Actinoplanes sp. G11-F43 TaxID=3424130 RepID=UPI003D32AAEC
MNDLELLDAYGPDAPGPSDAVLDATRARLLAAVPGRRPSPVRRRGLLMAGLGLAAAVAAGGVMIPRLTGPPAAPVAGPIRLVAATAPEFPYTLPGLGEAAFTADPGRPVIAVYPADDGSDVYLTSTDADHGKRFLGIGERDVEVGGRPGRILEPGDVIGGGPLLDLVWEHRDGVWLRLTGQGRYATAGALVDLAGRVEDKPQRLRFAVTAGLVPDGWELAAFKDENILMYRDPARPESEFRIQWTPRTEPLTRPEEIQGLERASTVTVRDRPADLFQATEFWMVQARLGDGSAFRLMTPRSFTSGQVLELAGSVRRPE